MSDEGVTQGRYNSLTSLINAVLTKAARTISSVAKTRGKI
jgi:hypothetical protein